VIGIEADQRVKEPRRERECVGLGIYWENAILDARGLYSFEVDTRLDPVITTRTNSRISVTSTSTVHHLNLLNGLVTGTSIKTTAATVVTSRGASSSGSVTGVGLKVGVTSLSAPAANTKVNLPGIGYVVLNEQTRRDGGKFSSSITVNAIDIYITQKNSLGLGAGAGLSWGMPRPASSMCPHSIWWGSNAYGMYAYGKSATVTLSSGPAAYASVGCAGGDSTNRVAKFSVSGVGRSGTIVDRATASISSSKSSSHGQAKILTCRYLTT
jgi:hypothetical protein